MHVKGFTMRHPEVAEEARGTFGGLSTAAVVDYLRALGVSAVELLPVHAFVHDRHLIERGLRNYWGYNTIGFFAPHPEYLGKGGLGEVKTFVQVMHEAGLEVILDVVYNHTAEGSHMGPTLSFRGIDNRSYYYLMGGQERYYNDFTGTGNALELRHPYVLRMVTDSLRYWVQEVRVDGFRFDLATTLARVEGPYDQHASFLDAVAQDPVLSAVKLIAEPWDTGLGGYQVGNFPPGWAEWNGKYRDTVRRFWKGDGGPDRRDGLARVGLGRHLQPPRPAALGERQLHHRARRLHAARPGELRRQAQRGQQGGQPRRRRRQPQLELRRRGRHRRSRDPRAAAAPDAQSSDHAAAVAGRADAARRRRVRAHPGRQQQPLLPGQRDRLARLEPGRGGGGAAWRSPGG